ncbi:MAG: hypothetical protein IJD97_00110 [Clostridia bacterium]|nr:hypothetical protein [Clostridia bacterium]
MKTIVTELIKKLILFILLLGFLWLALVAACTIPNEKIREKMEKSALYYKNTDAFSFENGKKLNAVSDNYADSIALNLSYNMGRGNPFKASLDTAYYSGGEEGLNRGLYRTVNEEMLPDTEYTRYWHGNAMIIRFMHLFTDISGIKTAGIIKVTILLAITLFILIIRKNYVTASSLFVSSILIHIWNLRLSLEYQSSFVIGFLMCILFLQAERKKEKALSYMALAGGILVAFFDFLTTETVAILLPLVLVTSARLEEGRLNDIKKYRKTLINCVISYASGYAFTFISKWAVASAFTGVDKFTEAFTKSQAVFERSGETSDNIFIRMINAVAANLTALAGGEKRIEFSRVFIYILIISLVVFSLLYLCGKREKTAGIYILPLLGAVVILRYMVMPGHSYMHNFFTYRALISTLTAVFASAGICITLRRGKKNGKA